MVIQHWHLLAMQIVFLISNLGFAQSQIQIKEWVDDFQAKSLDRLQAFDLKTAVISSFDRQGIEFLKLSPDVFNRSGFLQIEDAQIADFTVKLNSKGEGGNPCLESESAIMECLKVSNLIVKKESQWRILKLANGHMTSSKPFSVGEESEAEMQKGLSESLNYHGVVLEQKDSYLLIQSYPLSFPKLVQGLLIKDSANHLILQDRQSTGAGLIKMTQRLGPYSIAKVLIKGDDEIEPGTKVIWEGK